MISGILHVLKSGCRWCDAPPEYGPRTTIYNRFVALGRAGRVGERCSVRLPRAADRRTQMLIDSTTVKAHRSASGRKRMARPVGKWFVLSGLSSLRKRIRPSGSEPLAKMEIRASWSS